VVELPLCGNILPLVVALVAQLPSSTTPQQTGWELGGSLVALAVVAVVVVLPQPTLSAETVLQGWATMVAMGLRRIMVAVAAVGPALLALARQLSMVAQVVMVCQTLLLGLL